MTQPDPPVRPARFAPDGPLSDAEERQLATLAHLSGLLAIFPPLNLLPALVVYLVYGARGPVLRDQAPEALNFQITVFIAQLVAWFIGSLVEFDTHLTLVVWGLAAVSSVVAARACGRGERYRYPVVLRLLH